MTLGCTFKDALGALTTPTAVTCEIYTPVGTEIVIANSVVSTGVYTAAYTITMQGHYGVKWFADSKIATETSFDVNPTNFARLSA